MSGLLTGVQIDVSSGQYLPSLVAAVELLCTTCYVPLNRGGLISAIHAKGGTVVLRAMTNLLLDD